MFGSKCLLLLYQCVKKSAKQCWKCFSKTFPYQYACLSVGMWLFWSLVVLYCFCLLKSHFHEDFWSAKAVLITLALVAIFQMCYHHVVDRTLDICTVNSNSINNDAKTCCNSSMKRCTITINFVRIHPHSWYHEFVGMICDTSKPSCTTYAEYLTTHGNVQQLCERCH